MIGMTVGAARNAWKAAGFSGLLTTNPLHAPADATVTDQNQPVGACLPKTTKVVITAS
jgi:hypothetical protein